MTLLETIGYDELCVDVDVADLARVDEHAIAHIAPALTCHPDPPVDLAEVLRSDSPPARSSSGPVYDDRVVLGAPEVPRGLVGGANDPQTWWMSPFQAPALYGAALQDVLCFGGLPAGAHSSGHMLLAGGRFIVPDSYFVRNTVRSLPAGLVASVGAPGQGRFRLQVDTASITRSSGLHYFAGAAFGHFGHFLLEGLSRWWLLALLPEPVRAELRFVLYDEQPAGLATGGARVPGRRGRADRVPHGAAALRAHDRSRGGLPLAPGASSAQRDTWERIARAFDRGAGPARVYLRAPAMGASGRSSMRRRSSSTSRGAVSSSCIHRSSPSQSRLPRFARPG